MKYKTVLLLAVCCLLLSSCESHRNPPGTDPPTSAPEITSPETIPFEPELSLPEEDQLPHPLEEEPSSPPMLEGGSSSANSAPGPASIPDTDKNAVSQIAQDQPQPPAPPESAESVTPHNFSSEAAQASEPAASFSAFADNKNAEIASLLLQLINDERITNNIPALELEDSMQFAAAIRAQEALDSFSHTRPNGDAYHTVFDEAGFTYAGKFHGENLAFIRLSAGAFDTEAVAKTLFEEWRLSTGHHQNMLSENFVQTGLGIHTVLQGDMLTISAAQLFASL